MVQEREREDTNIIIVLFKIEEFNGHCMRVHLSMRFQAADNTGVSAI